MAPHGSSAHRVELTFDDGVYAKLICPESGCQPAGMCASCGRDLQDSETKPCYDCEHDFGDECWVKGWFDNLTADELLSGRLVVEIAPEFDGDTCTAHIVRAVEPVEATSDVMP